MRHVYIIAFIGLMVGVLGTGIGGVISLFIKKSNRVLSFLLGLTGGFMMFIVTFHLLPESFLLGNIFTVLLGIILGMLIVITIEKYIQNISCRPYLRTSIILGLSIGVHNFPEGLALGSSFLATSNFGMVLALAMLLHNIPEGISMAIPLRLNKFSNKEVILYTILAGIPTGVGAFLGAYLGSISNNIISLCLALAGGTMLYIICDEIIPTGKTLHKGRVSTLGVITGFIIGTILYL